MKPKNIFMPEELVAAVDQWRSAQPGLPSFAAAMRQLVGQGLEADRAYTLATEISEDRTAKVETDRDSGDRWAVMPLESWEALQADAREALNHGG